jgi:hypothetical protein
MVIIIIIINTFTVKNTVAALAVAHVVTVFSHLDPK